MAYTRSPGVYKITNTKTGIIYIGSSNVMQRRWHEHKSSLRRNIHGNDYLQNAWNKHGEDAFSFEVIEMCTEDSLLEREMYWCDALNVYNRDIGYNIRIADRSSMSEETKKKLSILHTGKKLSDETKRKLSEINKGKRRPHTEESKKKMSQNRKGMVFSEEHKKNLSAAHKGKKWTAEHHKSLGNKQKKKLTAENAEEIRLLRSQGWKYKALAEKFNVSEKTIYDTVKMKYHK